MYEIIVDATHSLNKEICSKYELVTVPMEFDLGGKRYLRYEDDRELSSKEFNALINNKEKITTFQVSPKMWMHYIEKKLKEKKDVIVLASSSTFSGTCNSALTACNILKKQYPNQKIEFIDTYSISTKYSALILDSLIDRNNNISFEDNIKNIKNNIEKYQTILVLDEVNHIIEGNRINKKEVEVVSFFNTKPILTSNSNGKVSLLAKQTGITNSINFIANKVKKEITNTDSKHIIISHSDKEMEAINLANLLASELRTKNVIVTTHSLVVNAHVGVGAVEIAYFKDNNK